MNEVNILVKGYAKKLVNGWIASSTATFIKSNGKNIIVDPGCNRKKLLYGLRKHSLKTGDIDYVILTHSHTDHTLLAGIFENAKILDAFEIYYGDKQVAHNNRIPGTSVTLLQTPGHTDDHCSMLFSTKKGIYAIAGDVFWWMDDEKQEVKINKKDAAHKCDIKKLIESRKKLLKVADYIVPGHGKVFKVEK